MVQVIDRLEDAGGAEHIQFRPYRSTRDPNRILASWGPHGVDEPGRMASIGQSQLGTPVALEFKRAFNEAVQYDVPFLWVDDPDGLFSPAKRPTRHDAERRHGQKEAQYRLRRRVSPGVVARPGRGRRGLKN